MPPTHQPLRSTLANDPDMRELVEFFVQEMPARIASLRKAYEGAAVADLVRLAHQLKGASGGYGFAQIGDQAGVLESTLKHRSGSDAQALAAIKSQLDALIDLCNRATSAP